MNREIKFRAWDEDFNTMVFSDDFKQLSEFFAYCERRRGDNITIGWKGITPYQQYTGLKDKNGVEIYEGDVVKVFTFNNAQKDKLFIVTFEDGAFSIRKVGTTIFNQAVTFRDCIAQAENERLPIPEYEVIGNIHKQ